jgi:hypothetical protein
MNGTTVKLTELGAFKDLSVEQKNNAIPLGEVSFFEAFGEGFFTTFFPIILDCIKLNFGDPFGYFGELFETTSAPNSLLL